MLKSGILQMWEHRRRTLTFAKTLAAEGCMSLLQRSWHTDWEIECPTNGCDPFSNSFLRIVRESIYEVPIVCVDGLTLQAEASECKLRFLLSGWPGFPQTTPAFHPRSAYFHGFRRPETISKLLKTLST